MQKIETITSRHNDKIKELKKLDLKKNRLESQTFLVENFTIIKDALDSGIDFETLFISQGFIDQHGDKFRYLDDNSKASYYVINESVNSAYSTLDTPSGISAVYKIIKKDLINKAPVIYLDNIKDPGNLGTIMRSAVAFGFRNLILGGHCVDVYNPKTISAAKDSIFNLSVLEDEEGTWLKDDKRPLYATSSHDGVNLQDFKAEADFCLVLGSESSGIEESILEKADEKIKIEMSENMESLNVAVAASIIFYKLRQ